MAATKQVIVIRKDLKMRRGKEIAQGAHASLKVFFDRCDNSLGEGRVIDDNEGLFMKIKLTDAMAEWVEGMFTKVTVYVNSESELLEVYFKAFEAGLPCSIIKDSGLTEFGGVPTFTAVAIGPDYSEKIDPITGGLTLY